ncbi:cytochrome b [Pseudooceanicola sp. C21-150M6]|uniref:cytochrome b n=1 Tax=Pseudooceanicola sp. C21-150M6 TaxID=3434355 RepID=UPI003D7F84C8
MQTTDQFSLFARSLHWIMALLVLCMIPAGFLMIQEGIPRGLQNALFLFHKNIGVLLLILVVIRALYRRFRPPAPLPADIPMIQQRMAALSHLALYGLLFLLPVAGYIRVKAGGFPIESLDALGVPALVPRAEWLATAAKTIHFLAGYAIAGVIAVHIAAAAYHGLVRRDGVFSRMWPPFRSPRSGPPAA